MKIHCKFDEMLDIKKIVLNPRNTNKHPKDQIERLTQIIEYQGFRHPIIISKFSSTVIAGEGRYLAAKKLKLKLVPVVYQDFESHDQERAFLTSDNAIASWSELDLDLIKNDFEEFDDDFDLDLLGIKDLDIEDKNKYADDEEKENDIPEVKEDPRTKLGDIWQLGDHRLMCGDCTVKDNVDKLMDGHKADMALLDPPYNYAENTACSKKNVGNSQLKDATWDIGYNPESVQLFNNLSSSFVLYIFTSPFLFGKTFAFVKDNSDFCGMMCFKKTTYNSNPIKKHPTWNIEPIVYATKGKHVFNYDQAEYKNALLEFAGEHFTNFVGHPTQKPLKLMEAIINNSSNEAFIVFDPFLGSGLTLIACEKTNRKCYGMEIDPQYVRVIIDRFEKYSNKKAVLINGN